MRWRCRWVHQGVERRGDAIGKKKTGIVLEKVRCSLRLAGGDGIQVEIEV